MTAYNTIAFDPSRCELCNDCNACMTACSQIKAGTDDLLHSRIKIVAGFNGNPPELALCRQCGDPECTKSCPSTALTKNPETGLIDWDESLCIDCLLCTVGCTYGGITYNAELKHVAKCDHCDGDPACVKACPSGALTYITSASIFNEQHEREDLFVPGLSACQGCNSEMIMRHSLRKVGPDTVLATPPGCIPGMGSVGFNGTTGTKVPVFHPLLTNTASMLAGVKKQYNRMGRNVTAMALAGDGGAGDVGFQSLSGAAERNDQILFICVDNEGYMNTGMQASGSTSYGSWTTTTPVGTEMKGKRTSQKNLAMIMMNHNCEYVATASTAFVEDYYEKLDKALAASERGFAYLHIYSPCPTGWRFPSSQTIEVCRKGVETNFAPLWEYERGGELRFTHYIDNPLPVEAYLNLSGKYRHVSKEQLAHIQEQVNERVKTLKRFAGLN